MGRRGGISSFKLFLPAFATRRGRGGGLGTLLAVSLTDSFTAEFNLFILTVLIASDLSELPVRPLRRSASANTDGKRGESPLRFSSHLFNQNVARLHSTTGPLASSGGYHIYLSRDGTLGHQFNKRHPFPPFYSQSLLMTDFKENHTFIWFYNSLQKNLRNN